MELLLFLVFIAVSFAILGISAAEFGVDSRGFSDDPHRSAYPVGLN